MSAITDEPIVSTAIENGIAAVIAAGWVCAVGTEDVSIEEAAVSVSTNPLHAANASSGRGTTSASSRKRRIGRPRVSVHESPLVYSVAEVAHLLGTTPKAIYTMIDRDQLPGVIRMGRRVRILRRVLVDWLDRKCASSPKENRR